MLLLIKQIFACLLNKRSKAEYSFQSILTFHKKHSHPCLKWLLKLRLVPINKPQANLSTHPRPKWLLKHPYSIWQNSSKVELSTHPRPKWLLKHRGRHDGCHWLLCSFNPSSSEMVVETFSRYLIFELLVLFQPILVRNGCWNIDSIISSIQ